MSLPFPPFSKRRQAAELPQDPAHRGYYALHDMYDDEEWDARLGRGDEALQREERQRMRWWQPGHWRERRKRWWAVRIVAGMLLAFFLLIGWLAITAPLSKSLEPIAPPQLTLLAADGTPTARNGAVVDRPIEVERLPKHVTGAFLAIEDRRFYSRWGMGPRGVGRAAWSNVSGGPTQGGSTITQQLAKFTFLTPERSLTRKAREMLIAFWLEAWLTKDEILERYLSNAYFGDNVYGLRAASLHYFYRQPENLLPAQAAMLAGLLQAPSRLAPTRHYGRAEERMKLVVGAMVAAGYLTEQEALIMRAPALDVREAGDLPTGTYFADWALPEARNLAGTGYSGRTLTTTLDSRLQRIARNVTTRAPLGEAQVALVAMRPNGEVVAMTGGKDYSQSAFNRVSQARRQPGSTFKLFVYLAALRSGMEPGDRIANTPFESGSYRPSNARGNYSDSMTLEDAFGHSSNVAAVRLLQQVGSENVIRAARDLGVSSALPECDPSLALGTSTMTLLELTAAYAGVAANSFPVEPHAYARENRGWIERLREWTRSESLSGRNHAAIESMLRAAVNRGTGRATMLSGPNFGKTGTTQDNRDALFVGYAGDLVVGVWIGNDDNSPLDGISGGGLPARIWRDFMGQALGGGPARPAPGPTESADPGGPVQPLDVPELDDIPLGEIGSRLRIREDGVTISTDIDGLPLDLRIGRDGIGIVPGEDEDEEERWRDEQERRREDYGTLREQREERAY